MDFSNQNTEPPEHADAPMIEVGRYPRHSIGRARALALQAIGLEPVLERQERTYVLRVAPDAGARALAELAAVEREEAELDQENKKEPTVLRKVPMIAVLTPLWVLCVCWVVQTKAGPRWLDAGTADAAKIVAGEWWRALTALTLHGDSGHVAANLAGGTAFAWLVMARFGVGLGWLALVVAGAMGNVVNALCYGSHHLSIGSSTAVFAALGLFIGWELIESFSLRSRERWRRWLLPLGGGLALLGWLGGGDGENPVHRVDVLAHLFGFLVGLPLGVVEARLRLAEKIGRRGQAVAGVLAAGLVALAWVLAWRV